MTEYIKLVKKLESDLQETGKILTSFQGNSALECSYVRAVFATLEGIFFAFKQEVIESKDFKNLFDLPTQAEIKEQKYDQKTNTITTEKQFLSFKDAVKKSSKALAKVRGIDPDILPFNGSEWENLLIANSIRDKITHPKSVDDSILGNEKLKVIVKAKVWLKDKVFVLLV